MSELKAYIGVSPDEKGLTDYYLKTDVDKVIAEKDDKLEAVYQQADHLLACLKCLVMRDLIKDCPEKASAIDIVKKCDLW